MLLGLATPVALAVLVYFGYALVAFREREPECRGRRPRRFAATPASRSWWLVVTTTIVLFLAGFGTIGLLADGAGGGQGPNPIAAPGAAKATTPLQVQVIAQQWQFTYRWPGLRRRRDARISSCRPTRRSSST